MRTHTAKLIAGIITILSMLSFSDKTSAQPCPRVPSSIKFAGQVIDLTSQDLYERMDRELISFTYSHASTLLALKKQGIWFFGADMDGQPATKTDMKGAVGIVIGSEGFGLSAPVRAQCDGILSLPMFGKVNSLNASVAAGILLYEVVRQRTADVTPTE